MRTLNTATLDLAARQWAAAFLQDSVWSRTNPEVAIAGRDWVLQSFVNADFKDEFEYLLKKFKKQLGPQPLLEFEKFEVEFKPRSDKVLKEMLAEKLAIDVDGKHIPGRIGKVQVGGRVVGRRLNPLGKVVDAVWPIYAGEDLERQEKDGGAAEALPEGKKIFIDDEHLQEAK